MGLDQYAYRIPKKYKIDSLSFSKEISDKELVFSREFFYLRKNYLVDDFMQDLYVAKGGKEEFNCKYVEVTEEDLDALYKLLTDKKYITGSALEFEGIKQEFYEKIGATYTPITSEVEVYTEDAQDGLEFIEAAHRVLQDGELVYYSNWW